MDKIRVVKTRGSKQFLVWSPTSVIRLRTHHRIIGSLIGLEKQSLPLQLTPFEVRLLRDQGVIEIVVQQDLCSQTLEEVKKDYFKQHQQREEEYQRLFLEEKERVINMNSIEIIKKHRERNPEKMESDQDIIKSTLERERSKITLPVHFMKDSVVSHPKPSDQNDPDLSLSPHDDLKFKVFSDLHSKGFFLTSGFQFACDFLVYEKDPYICHSKFMVVCRLEGVDNLNPLQVTSLGRLSVSVKKQVLVAYLTMSDGHEKVSYTKIKWEGKGQEDVTEDTNLSD